MGEVAQLPVALAAGLDPLSNQSGRAATVRALSPSLTLFFAISHGYLLGFSA
jgi:hypothetical protein